MNDVERFIGCLLRADRKAQDNFAAACLPLQIFTVSRAEVTWLYQYRESKGFYPSLTLYQNRFSPLESDDTPLDESLEVLVDRSMFLQMEQIISTCKGELGKGQSYREVMEVFRQGASGLTDYTLKRNEEHAATGSAFERYSDRVRAQVTNSLERIVTPWEPMNALIDHFSIGELAFICARPSMGKSWLMLWWSHFLATKGYRVLFINFESTVPKMMDRLECMLFDIPYPRMRGGSLSAREGARWKKGRRKPFKLNFKMVGRNEVGGTTPGLIESQIREYKPEVVFLDGAYLMQVGGSSTSTVERFSAISKAAVNIAQLHEVFLVGSLQENRTREQGQESHGTPSLASLYGSDAWAQDADAILSLGGQRGSSTRQMHALKLREAPLGEWGINFTLDPKPDFGFNAGVSTKNEETNGKRKSPYFKKAE